MLFTDAKTMEKRELELASHFASISFELPQKVVTDEEAIAGVKEHLLSCGMDDYIVKPVDEGVLFKTLREYLPVEKIKLE